MTKACLNDGGTIPCVRESFIIQVIDSTMLSICLTNREVGIGSSEHDLGGDVSISSLTYSTLTGLKIHMGVALKSSKLGTELH